MLGVSSFILVGLERVPRFEEAVLLEFGRGFRYTRPLRVNIMDLDYELMEELVGFYQYPVNTPPHEDHLCLFLSRTVISCVPFRTILLRGSAAQCHASAQAPEEIEVELAYQDLR